MQGVITRVQVLQHPLVIVESFGVKVLVRALLASPQETFLEIVSHVAEEEAHQGMDELDLARTVRRFIGYEVRLRDLYRRLSVQLSATEDAAAFFAALSGQEEGHAIVLSRVRRELRRGHLWKASRELHLAGVEELEARLDGCEREIRGGVPLARALEIAEGIEGSEVNVVFDTLNGCVDMRSRARFERFFVLTEQHLAFCREQIAGLRARHRLSCQTVNTSRGARDQVQGSVP